MKILFLGGPKDGEWCDVPADLLNQLPPTYDAHMPCETEDWGSIPMPSMKTYRYVLQRFMVKNRAVSIYVHGDRPSNQEIEEHLKKLGGCG